MIISKCPLRISLAGGSTDLQAFIDEFGYGSVINFAADLHTYVTISTDRFGESSKNNKYIINYSRREEETEISKIKNDIARECFQHFNTPPNTSSLTADIFSSGSGLASSSSYLIAFIKALVTKNKINLSNKNICELALILERKFNPLTGYQDPYGCGIGGFKKININKKQPSRGNPVTHLRIRRIRYAPHTYRGHEIFHQSIKNCQYRKSIQTPTACESNVKSFHKWRHAIYSLYYT